MSDRLVVVIPTLNEALHIQRAVQSGSALAPVVVVDSGSLDGTGALAAAAGADVLVHEWEGFSAQKNWAIQQLKDATDWILFLDADEILTADLIADVRDVLSGGTSRCDGYWIPRRLTFLGRELRHAWWYPDYQLRFFRPNLGEFEDRLVHEHVKLRGAAGYLSGALIHDDRRGMKRFLERHVAYAALEAREMARGPMPRGRGGGLSGGWAERRRLFKRIWSKMPGRPIARFLWLYLVKRGFLDGTEGYAFCKAMVAYELMIDLMRADLARTGAGRSEN